MRTTPPSPFYRYLRALLVGVPVTLVIVITFNRLIDPYNFFGGPHIEGINTQKTEFSKHLRMSKAAAISRFQPAAVILGTSRGEIGIDPQHPGWSASPVYNLALSGANLYEAFRYLQHADAMAPVKQVVLMLDFFMFNANENPEEPDFDERRLAVSEDGLQQRGTYGDLTAVVASLDALYASLHTVRKQHAAGQDLYRQDGFRLWDKKARAENRRAGGQRERFRSNEKGYYDGHYNRFAFANPFRDNDSIFRRLLQLAERKGIELHIAISPSHARQFETIAAKGAWDKFEGWKRQLVQNNVEEARHTGRDPFPIWDFSGYNSMTSEVVPPLGDVDSEMRWYWESSHYKRELGDLVLDRIFSYQSSERTVPDDFGVRLTAESIEGHLGQIRADREQWRREYPEDAAEIDALKVLDQRQ